MMKECRCTRGHSLRGSYTFILLWTSLILRALSKLQRWRLFFEALVAIKSGKAPVDLWHQRLGHPNSRLLHVLDSKKFIDNRNTRSSSNSWVQSTPSLLGTPHTAMCPVPPAVVSHVPSTVVTPTHLLEPIPPVASSNHAPADTSTIPLAPQIVPPAPATSDAPSVPLDLQFVSPAAASSSTPHEDLVTSNATHTSSSSPIAAPHGSTDSRLASSNPEFYIDLPTALPPTAPPLSTNVHPMLTRKKARDLHGLVALKDTDPTEPKSVKTALQSPHWFAAMCDEISALKQNQTWELVPRQDNMNVVGSRWVFKTKLKSDGSIDRFKARLVAQGFSQSLGIEVLPFSGGLFLSQQKYAHDLLARSSMTGCNPIGTPLAPKHNLRRDDPIIVDATNYRSIVGALQYITLTRPDLTHAVNLVCQFMHQLRCFSLSGSQTYLTLFTGHFGLWSSVTFTGLIASLGPSKKQATVSRSSAEAEYRSMSTTTAELTWLLYLLRDIGIHLPNPPVLFCDNTSALHMTVNPVFHARTKHIELDVHFVREKVAAGALVTRFVPTHLQIADIFTKALSKDSFQRLRSKLGVMLPPTSSLRGSDKCESQFTYTVNSKPRISSVLPPKSSTQLTDMELDECEETTLHDVNIEDEMRRKQHSHSQEAYDEDEEMHGGAQRVQCAQQ
uniref:GAG-pre-integrase domain-containing protein n=1 Tax=Fagus sylvatica TaxID=28930 RepID=A0A2N9I2K2_FAGSY